MCYTTNDNIIQIRWKFISRSSMLPHKRLNRVDRQTFVLPESRKTTSSCCTAALRYLDPSVRPRTADRGR